MYEGVETITLSKAINDTIIAKHQSSSQQPINIIVRMNLDTHNCKVFNEESEIFTISNGIKYGYSISYLFMEWNFLSFDPIRPERRLVNSKCTEEEVGLIVEFLSEIADYSAFDTESRKQLSDSELMGPKLTWITHHVLWIHNSITEKVRKTILLHEINIS